MIRKTAFAAGAALFLLVVALSSKANASSSLDDSNHPAATDLFAADGWDEAVPGAFQNAARGHNRRLHRAAATTFFPVSTAAASADSEVVAEFEAAAADSVIAGRQLLATGPPPPAPPQPAPPAPPPPPSPTPNVVNANPRATAFSVSSSSLCTDMSTTSTQQVSPLQAIRGLLETMQASQLVAQRQIVAEFIAIRSTMSTASTSPRRDDDDDDDKSDDSTATRAAKAAVKQIKQLNDELKKQIDMQVAALRDTVQDTVEKLRKEREAAEKAMRAQLYSSTSGGRR